MMDDKTSWMAGAVFAFGGFVADVGAGSQPFTAQKVATINEPMAVTYAPGDSERVFSSTLSGAS